MTVEQAATSSHKNLVTRALGVEDTALLELNEHAVVAGDLYMLCSDGLSDMANDVEIAIILGSQASLPQKADRLVALANELGGRDNISVLLVQAGSAGRRRGLISRLLRK